MGLFKRWIVIMIALWLAALLPGIHVDPNSIWTYAVMAAILALLNAILLPILRGLSCGMIVLTLGLFSLVLNAGIFMLASHFSTSLGYGFKVDSFWWALAGSIIVSIATSFFSGESRHSDRGRSRSS